MCGVANGCEHALPAWEGEGGVLNLGRGAPSARAVGLFGFDPIIEWLLAYRAGNYFHRIGGPPRARRVNINIP
jgi:hypothetical protein